MNISFSIVIPNHKRSHLLTKLLESISKAIIPPNLDKILIIENGDVSENESICISFSNKIPVQHFFIKEKGASHARNFGASQAVSQIIIFFDDDILIEENTLLEYSRQFDIYGAESFFGGSIKARYETPPPEWIVDLLPPSAKGYNPTVSSTPTDKLYFLGGNMAIPKSLLLEAGGFDPYCPTGDSNTGFGGEETRIQQKLYQKGYKGIYIPGATTYHYVPKERCSEAWLLHRRYREGLGDSVDLIKNDKNIHALGYPKWILKKKLFLTLKILAKHMTRRSHKDIFKDKLELKTLQGLADGYRELAKKNSS